MLSLQTQRLGLSAALLSAMALAGCSEPPEAPPAPMVEPAPVVAHAVAPPAAVGVVTAVAATPETKPAAPEATDAEALTPTPADVEVEKPAVAQYQPPFPDRVDLFVPPKRQGGMVLKEGESEDAVELLGFVRLDRQQVVLSINGQVTPIFEGATQYGIEVISIQPPKVVLQRGRQRWQASLEN